MEKIDLHIHSSFSDGDDFIDDIIKYLKDNNYEYFSITDHDSIESYYEIKNKDLGNLKYISGVEISTYHNMLCFHILGYNFHGNIESLEKLLEDINKKRVLRAKESIKKIEERNHVKFLDDDIKKVLSYNVVGKKQIAKLLKKNNFGDDYTYLLKNYMTGLHPSISYRVDIKDACLSIKNSGGTPVLAHPKEYETRYNIKIEDYIEELIKSGILGIEVFHSIHTLEDTLRYLSICKKYNLLITGGSDYHGKSKNNTKIGDYIKLDNEHFTIIDVLNK